MMLRLCAVMARSTRGLWDYLIRREDRRRNVDLVRARTEGAIARLRALPEGAHMVEVDGDGHGLAIWMPDRKKQSLPLPAVQLQVISGKSANDHA